MVTPAEQRHLQFELRLGFIRGEHDMVGRAILEAAARYDANVLADVAEPELRGVEEMRAEVRQNARALVAPLGLSHQPRRTVSVEHAAVIERAKRAVHDRVAHPHKMRLKAVIVGDIAERALLSRRGLEP